MAAGDDGPRVSRRDAIMAAAVSVLAERGPRGLTHRAVDAAAGLSTGSVNYHAPTRARLLSLALEEVFRRDVVAAREYFHSRHWNREAAIDAIARFVFEMSSESHRERVIARHHLRAESLTNPELRSAFDVQHDSFVRMIQALFATAGTSVSPTAAELIRLSLDGMMARQVFIGAAPMSREQVTEMTKLLVDI